jgi:hypothetical protein
LTGEECGYVPTWVVMDKKWNVVDFDCGNKKKTSGLVDMIESTGVEFKK